MDASERVLIWMTRMNGVMRSISSMVMMMVMMMMMMIMVMMVTAKHMVMR